MQVDSTFMITIDDARALREAGLVWHPATGDAFTIDRPELQEDVFTLSDMTIESHEFETGTILGFNGTTEWALDSVAIEDALWLPREDQLRQLLGGSFRSLRRVDDTREADSGEYSVHVVFSGEPKVYSADEPATAYAKALLTLISMATE
jgi:hypothetical protein